MPAHQALTGGWRRRARTGSVLPIQVSAGGHPIAGAERVRPTAGAAERPLIDRREGNTLQPLSYSK